MPTTARNVGSVDGIAIPARSVVPSVILMLHVRAHQLTASLSKVQRLSGSNRLLGLGDTVLSHKNRTRSNRPVKA